MDGETGNRIHLTYILLQEQTRNFLPVVTGRAPQTTTSFLNLSSLSRKERPITLPLERHKPVIIPVPGKNGHSAHVSGRSKRKGWHITLQCNSVLDGQKKLARVGESLVAVRQELV